MDFSKTAPHGFFQGLNPWGISCSKGFNPPWDSSQESAPFFFSTDPQIPAKIQLQDELPVGHASEFLGISTPAPWNRLQESFPCKIPALETNQSVPGLVSSNLILTPKASSPFPMGSAGHRRSFRKRPVESSPGASRNFGRAKPILMEKHRDWAGKNNEMRGKNTGMRRKNTGMRRKTLGMREKLSGWRGKNSNCGRKATKTGEKLGMGRKKNQDELEKH